MQSQTVFEYLSTDEGERKIYENIIIKIEKNLKELRENLGTPELAESSYEAVIRYTKNLEKLVMLRKAYIEGWVDSPRSKNS